jgi:tartrate dehydratase alpha subunit/fumarate hydratase class I-like protein
VDVRNLFKQEYSFLLDEAIKKMIVDVVDIEKYPQKPSKGYIGYDVGGTYTTQAKDSYKTMFAYYYNYEKDAENPSEDSVRLETLEKEKALGIICAEYSYAEGPLTFSMIMGVTGTLQTLSKE